MIFFCVVVYNKKFDESQSIINILPFIDNLKKRLIVIDNSTSREILDYNFKFKNQCFKYISNNKKNIGLSKAYNRVLDELMTNFIKHNSENYVCWLDDDTQLTKSFIEKLLLSLNYGYDIIVPIIRGQNGLIYSPNRARPIKNKLIKHSIHRLNTKNFNAINSCLTVNLKLYKDYRYDTKLFVDQVDQLFFDYLRINKFTYKVLDEEIVQNFSQRNFINGTEYLERFKLRSRDIMKYGVLSPSSNIYYSAIKILLLSLQMTIKTRQIEYLQVGISSIFYK